MIRRDSGLHRRVRIQNSAYLVDVNLLLVTQSVVNPLHVFSQAIHTIILRQRIFSMSPAAVVKLMRIHLASIPVKIFPFFAPPLTLRTTLSMYSG